MPVHGTIIQDPETGRIVTTLRTTLAERYPTGRKNCSKCTRWRHLIDFGIRSDKEGCLQSWCNTCRQRYARRPGGKPREAKPSPVRRNQQRREAYKRYMTWVKAHPNRHQEYLEDIRIRQYDARRRQGVPVRPLKVKRKLVYVDPDFFLEWLLWNPSAAKHMTDNEARRVRNIQNGLELVINLDVVDNVMSRAGHHDQVSVLYPPGSEVMKWHHPRKPKTDGD